MTKKGGLTAGKILKTVSTVIAALLTLVLLPILLMNLTIIIKSAINPDVVPDFFGVKPLVVVSGSMEPTIMTNDIVFAREVEPSSLKEGDIIAFLQEGKIITHRIIGLNEQDGKPSFTTQGDWENAAVDKAPVTYDQVQGVFWFRIPYVGGLSLLMSKPLGMLLFIGVPLLGFLAYDILRRRSQNKKDRKVEDSKEAEIEALKAMLAQTQAAAPVPVESVPPVSPETPMPPAPPASPELPTSPSLPAPPPEEGDTFQL